MKTTRKKKWPCLNLAELVAFWRRVYGEDLSVTVLADDMGVSPQRLSYMMRRDDAMLSTVQKMVMASGYELHLEFRKCAITGGASNDIWPCAGELSESVRIIYAMNRTANSAAAISGVSRDVIYRAFRMGDIMISQLMKLSHSLGITVVWHFNKIVALEVL